MGQHDVAASSQHFGAAGTPSLNQQLEMSSHGKLKAYLKKNSDPTPHSLFQGSASQAKNEMLQFRARRP